MQTRPDKSNVNRSFMCNSLLGPTEPRNLIGEVHLNHFEGGRHHGSGWFFSRIEFMVSTGTHRRQQRQNECWTFGPCGDCGDPSMLCSKALLWERLWRRNVPTLQPLIPFLSWPGLYRVPQSWQEERGGRHFGGRHGRHRSRMHGPVQVKRTRSRRHGIFGGK